MLRFPYQRVTLRRPAPTLGGGTVRFLPFLSVGVAGPGGVAAVRFRLDSGADDTILPISVVAHLGLDLTNAPLAEDLRNQLREKMREGKSDAEVVDFLVERYGDFVLYRPPLKLTTVLLWFGPLLLLAAGFVVLLRRILRRPPAQDPEMTASERKRAAELLAGSEAYSKQKSKFVCKRSLARLITKSSTD